jgi:preprotein translocase subunit YajC
MNQLTQISIFCFLLLIIIIIHFYFSFQKLKTNENKRLNTLSSQIISEKNIATKLINISSEIATLDNFTQKKILNIKVAIFNIDFTLKEIL